MNSYDYIRFKLLVGFFVYFFFADEGAQHAAERGRLLRDVHFDDRLGRLGPPRAEPLEQLHAAEREREGARVARHVLVDLPCIEQRHVRVGQRARRVQGQREADDNASI